MKHFYLLLILIFTAGCSGNVSVSGKIQFPDGEPLTQGFVIFETGSEQFKGAIDSSGNYSMGVVTSGEGIKRGEYKVRVFSQSGGGSDGSPLVLHVAEKYDNVNTSGLTCNVQGTTVYDITVEKPNR